MITAAWWPSRANATGKAPLTSANPPVFAKGTASLVAKRIFMAKLRYAAWKATLPILYAAWKATLPTCSLESYATSGYAAGKATLLQASLEEHWYHSNLT